MFCINQIKRITFVALVLAMSVCGRASEHPRLTFVTPSIVRVQWTPQGATDPKGNGTGVPLNRKFIVKVVGAGEKTIDYSGERVNVKM